MSVKDIRAALRVAAKAADDTGGLVQAAADAVDGYLDGQSDRWREGAKGEQFESLKARLEEIIDALGELPTIYDDHIE